VVDEGVLPLGDSSSLRPLWGDQPRAVHALAGLPQDPGRRTNKTGTTVSGR